MNILITAGPTREHFDTVRFISNASSGKMGYAIAAEAVRRGHRAHMISGPVSLSVPPGAEVTHCDSAERMLQAVLCAFPACDAAIMTAAVCDYRPRSRQPHKLKKQDRPLTVELEPTVDICARLGSIKRHRVVIGFAMEDRNDHANAEAKLHRKNCDAMVLNGAANVGSDSATVEVFQTGPGWSAPMSGTKRDVARYLVDLTERLVGERSR